MKKGERGKSILEKKKKGRNFFLSNETVFFDISLNCQRYVYQRMAYRAIVEAVFQFNDRSLNISLNCHIVELKVLTLVTIVKNHLNDLNVSIGLPATLYY